MENELIFNNNNFWRENNFILDKIKQRKVIKMPSLKRIAEPNVDQIKPKVF